MRGSKGEKAGYPPWGCTVPPPESGVRRERSAAQATGSERTGPEKVYQSSSFVAEVVEGSRIVYARGAAQQHPFFSPVGVGSNLIESPWPGALTTSPCSSVFAETMR